MKLDLGSGHVRLEGWTSVDLDPEAEAEYRLPIQDVGIAFDENSIEEIRAYHVLEHISPKEVFPTLRAWWKILEPGGRVTIEVPNVEYAIMEYAHCNISWAEVERIILGADQDATEWMVHRCLFSSGKMKRFLTVTGFVDIDVCAFSKKEVVNITATKPLKKRNTTLVVVSGMCSAKKLSEGFAEAMGKEELGTIPENSVKNKRKQCTTCKYKGKDWDENPCFDCGDITDGWKDEKEPKNR